MVKVSMIATGFVASIASVLGFHTPPLYDAPTQSIVDTVVPVEEVAAAVEFDCVVSDGFVRTVLRDHGVKPYIVYIANAGYVGSNTVRKQFATLGRIDSTRVGFKKYGVALQRTYHDLLRRYQANQLKMDTTDIAIQHFLASLLQKDDAIQQARTDVPIIYAVEVVGSPASIDSLSRDARIVNLHRRSGFQWQNAITIPQPPMALRAATVANQYVAQVKMLNRRAVRERLESLVTTANLTE